MTARDIINGRQGGRVEKWKPMAGPVAHVVCLCGYAIVIPRSVGKTCQVCGEKYRELDRIDWAIRNHERARAGLAALPLPEGLVAAGPIETAAGLAEARDELRKAS